MITDVFEWLKTSCPIDFFDENVFLAVPGQAIPTNHDGRFRVTLCDHARSDDDVTLLLNNTIPGGLVLLNANPAEVLHGHDAKLDDIFFDYFEYESSVFIGRTHGPNAHFLPEFPDSLVTSQRASRNLIYVLCPNTAAVEKAREVYADKKWARIIWIPSTFYLESVAYFHTLASRTLEWQHADYVGCIGWSAYDKLNSLDLDDVIAQSPNNADVVAFMFRGDHLVATADKWHPNFSKIWIPTLESMGYKIEDIVSTEIPSFYCNYWAARPSHMAAYIAFFQKFKVQLENLYDIQGCVWSDSLYKDRGTDIAKLNDEQCMTIWGVPFYTYHPFVCERLPCFFFWSIHAKLAGVRS
jgi:hypothetical protein